MSSHVVLDINNKIVNSNHYHLCKGSNIKIENKEARDTIKK